MQNKKLKVIIDTDPGCDDMMAILYLLNQPSIEVIMLTLVDGNVCLDHVTNNSKKILKMAGKVVPLYRGSSNPIVKSVPNIESYHYEDGLGDIEEIKKYDANDIQIEQESAIVKMVECIEKNKGDISLVCLGPLTTVAAALMLNPDLPQMVNAVYMMGGSTLSRGNTIPSSEFNYVYDYVAAHMVLSQFKNIIITPWESTITSALNIKDETILSLSTNITNKKKNLNQILFNFVSLIIQKFTNAKGGTELCDLYAVIPLTNKTCVKSFSMCKVDVIVDSNPMRGMMRIINRTPITKNYEQFVAEDLAGYKENGYHLIIEDFDDKVVLEEYEHVFVQY